MKRKKQDIIVGVVFYNRKSRAQNALESNRTSLFWWTYISSGLLWTLWAYEIRIL